MGTRYSHVLPEIIVFGFRKPQLVSAMSKSESTKIKVVILQGGHKSRAECEKVAVTHKKYIKVEPYKFLTL